MLSLVCLTLLSLATTQDSLPAAKIDLGRRLFYDPSLSSDGSVSCASCHQQAFAFSDAGSAKSAGVLGRKGIRNAPSLSNLSNRPKLLWDARGDSLESHSLAPLFGKDEMNMTEEALLKQLELSFSAEFKVLYGDLSLVHLADALAAFQRTLVSNQSAYDAFLLGDAAALSINAQQGLELFKLVGCSSCHLGADLTDDKLHNTSLHRVYADSGLERVTSLAEDIGKFRTPSLRNVAVTAPFMHNGSQETLSDVLEHYDSGGKGHANAAEFMQPLGLSEQEKLDIIAFLNSLTDDSFLTNPLFSEP